MTYARLSGIYIFMAEIMSCDSDEYGMDVLFFIYFSRKRYKIFLTYVIHCLGLQACVMSLNRASIRLHHSFRIFAYLKRTGGRHS